MAGNTGRVRSATRESTVHPKRNAQAVVKVEFVRGELWPYFEANRTDRNILNDDVTRVPQKTFLRWVQVMRQFEQVQREMRHYYDQTH